MEIDYDVDVLTDLRTIEQEILDYVVNECKNNHLRYSLGYGTLIGAVRHKGFIPWDDDIDIIMPRNDYEKLVSILVNKQQKDYYLQNYYTDKQFTENFSKVRKNKTTFYSKTSYCNPDMCGIFIDIFPADRVPKSKVSRFFQFVACAINLLYTKRHVSDSSIIIRMVEKILFCFPKSIQIKLRNKSEVIKRKWNKYDAGMFVNSSTIIESRTFYPEDLFDEFIDVEFEGKKYKSIKKYNEFLTIMYGDYMSLPPIAERVGRHLPDILDFKRNYTEIGR